MSNTVLPNFMIYTNTTTGWAFPSAKKAGVVEASVTCLDKKLPCTDLCKCTN